MAQDFGMSWWRALFKKTNRNPFALPPEGFPPEMLRRVQPPSRSRKLTEEEKAADLERYRRERRQSSSVAWEHHRKQAEKAGCARYIWRSANDSDVCSICRGNNGKRFAYAKAPKGGHPGDGHDCATEPCRCYAEAIIPD